MYNYISAKDVASETNVINGINVYKILNGYVQIDWGNLMAWQYITKKQVLKENSDRFEWIEAAESKHPLLTDEDMGGIEKIEKEMCVLFRRGTHNYWHFTFECFDRIVMMEKAGYTGMYMIIDTSFSRALIKLLDVDEQRVIFANKSMDGRIYNCKNMICLESFVYSEGKTFNVLCEWAKQFSGKIRAEKVGKYPIKLYVKRIGSRKLIGADEMLEKYGFETMIPEEHSVEEQIEYFACADVVFSAHGANSTNLLYMKPGTTLIESFGKNYCNLSNIYVADYMGLKYRMLSVTHTSRDIGKETDDYSIAPPLLENTLKQISFPSNALFTEHGTMLCVDELENKIINECNFTRYIRAHIVKSSVYLLCESNNMFISDIEVNGRISWSVEPVSFSIEKNGNNTISIKKGNTYLSARNNGSCTFMDKNLAWEQFRLGGFFVSGK